VNFFSTTYCLIQEESTLQSHRRGNLTSKEAVLTNEQTVIEETILEQYGRIKGRNFKLTYCRGSVCGHRRKLLGNSGFDCYGKDQSTSQVGGRKYDPVIRNHFNKSE
jgi:hypothetical protein